MRNRQLSWQDIEGWFQWRSAQEEAVRHFNEGSCFVEVGVYLGRSICSLADLGAQSGKRFEIFGIDTCRGSGPEGPRRKDYHGAAVAKGGGTFAGQLHKNIVDCGYADLISLIITDSGSASRLLNDPGAYNDVRGLLQRMDSLLADIKKNPKRYINLRVF